mmetsp:Transcript_11787/g.37521  ORF Transcript_11787/g.37521 Transcript_11787/m.37521 type:complete len:327 (-) Transcript_11787:168-1148(-)
MPKRKKRKKTAEPYVAAVFSVALAAVFGGDGRVVTVEDTRAMVVRVDAIDRGACVEIFVALVAGRRLVENALGQEDAAEAEEMPGRGEEHGEANERHGPSRDGLREEGGAGVVGEDDEAPEKVLVQAEMLANFLGDTAEGAGEGEARADGIDEHEGVVRPEGEGVNEVPLQGGDLVLPGEGHREAGELDGQDAEEGEVGVGHREERGVELALHVERLEADDGELSHRARVGHASRRGVALRAVPGGQVGQGHEGPDEEGPAEGAARPARSLRAELEDAERADEVPRRKDRVVRAVRRPDHRGVLIPTLRQREEEGCHVEGEVQGDA